MPVEDVTNDQDEKFPILIEEVYNPKQIKEHEEAKVDSDSADHLFILVHGLGGSSADMK